MELCIRNRRITESDLITIRGVIREEGELGRTHLSRRLCRLWDWRQANSDYREIACRDLLRQLEDRGLIELPKALCAARRPGYKSQVQTPCLSTDPVEAPLQEIRREVQIVPVASALERQRLNELLAAYHYLGYRQPTGPSLGYLVFWRQRPLACARFGPAAWQVAARDQFIGWSPAQRRLGLRHLVNNDRWLILPWVRVAHLASFVLGTLSRRLAQDWWRIYREAIVLAETFVESERFQGVCYQAANWICLGETRGRGRDDREFLCAQPNKSVWVFALGEDFRQRLVEVGP